MSLYKDASLVMLPSAYKDGKLYSIRPTDGSGDFTFSRGSNLAATRVDVNGLIEKGRENLLFPSENTNTGWSASGTGTNTSSIQTGQQDPNGGTRGFRWTATCGSTINDRAFYRKNHTRDGSYLTLSFWVKSANGSNQTITFHYAGGQRSTINVTTEWQRVEYGEATGAGVGYFGAEIRGTISDTSADVYLYGWQLEKSLVATDYIETGASTAQAGILEDMPRLDYSGGASCPALLLEPQRTNEVPNSEYFAVYNLNDCSVTSNGATSPEGVDNATKLFDGTGSGGHYISGVANAYFANTEIRNTSVFAKAGTLDHIQIRLVNRTGSFSYYLVDVDLNDGSVIHTAAGQTTNTSNEVEDYGNGWYRITLKCSFTDTNVLSSGMQIFTHNGTTHSYVGTGTDYVLIYGAQHEAGSYPTSYIPTYGSSVTRNAEGAGVQDSSLSSVIGQNAGVIFADLDLVDHSSTADHRFSISSGSSQNWIFMSLENGDRLRYYIRTANTQRIDSTISGAISKGNSYKIAFRYETGNNAVFINGVKIQSNSTAFPAPDSDLIRFNISGTSPDSSNSQADIFTKVKQTLTFPTALTDSECIALTTL